MKIKARFYNLYKKGDFHCELIPSVNIGKESLQDIYKAVHIGFGWLFWCASITISKRYDYGKA